MKLLENGERTTQHSHFLKKENKRRKKTHDIGKINEKRQVISQFTDF